MNKSGNGMELHSRIYVAGHRGLVGSAIVRALLARGFNNVITRTRDELDLLNRRDVDDFFTAEQPDYVFLAAARVGGIGANNTYRYDFIYENLQLQNNVIDAAFRNNVNKLLFLGSSCIYPKLAPQPLREDYLLTGPLEPTNEPYAVAKIAGIKLCEALRDQYGVNFISCMPTNLYGPNDNYDLETSHVLPALIRRFHEARERGDAQITLWGSGTPRREFLHVDDAAAAMIFLMEHYEGRDFVNIGTGEDISIRDLAELMKLITGFEGEILWDSSKPDGTPRKLMSVDRLHALGWRHRYSLREGIEHAYEAFKRRTQAEADV